MAVKPDGDYPTTTRTKCSGCEREFTVTVRFDKVERENGIGEHVWFACPHCAMRYDAAYISPRGVEVRRKLAESRGRMRERPSDALATAITRLEYQMRRETRPGAAAARAGKGQA